MTIRMHRSTDLGAPLMTGQQGKMCSVLLEVLCKGVPAASPASITQSDGVATCAYTGHKFMTGQTVSVYGADQANYNGNKVITVIDANTFTFPVDSGTASPATGTISVGGQRTAGTATLTRSGTTVTVALTGHGLSVGNRAFLLGAAQAEYNGWQTVATVADANTFTFELPSTYTPATPATGTITVRYGEAGLGWSMPFTGTNRSIFKQGVSGVKNQSVLIVDETNATNHTYGAGMNMAEGATALSTITNLMGSAEYPTTTGMMKSATADTVARGWVVVGDHRTVIIMTQPGYAGAAYPSGWFYSYFGDFVSYLPNDAYGQLSAPSIRLSSGYGFAASASFYNQYATQSMANNQYLHLCGGTLTTAADAGNYPFVTYRTHLGATGPVLGGIAPASHNLMKSYGNAQLTARMLGCDSDAYYMGTYPDPVHGGFNLQKLHYLHRSTINSGDPVVRGELRGLWNPGHSRAQASVWANNDILIGTGELAGRTFECFISTGHASNWWMVETSDTWSS